MNQEPDFYGRSKQPNAAERERLQRELQEHIAKQKNYDSRMRKVHVCLLLIAIIAVIGPRIFLKAINTKSVASLDYIEEPKQEPTSGSATVSVTGRAIPLEYVATYEVSGRVVATWDYFGPKRENLLSPTDVSIVWDFLSDKQVDKKIRWSVKGTRFLTYQISDMEWYQSLGEDALNDKISNNHLIPKDFHTKMLIKSIKKGDFVRLEGYLVNVQESGILGMGRTSTNRYDSGGGACEIIYVTRVVWLKEE